MTEADAIEAVDEPATVSSLVEDLRGVGVEPGDTLFVHASLRAIGWVSGSAQAVVEALQAAVTERGTLVVPTHSFQLSDPADWSNPPVPDDWVEPIRDSQPAYRPAVTPTRGMGAIPECLRTDPDAVRSAHPTLSCAAWGQEAEEIVADHSLSYPLGEDSPLARVYDRGGDVFLLGVGYDVNTSIHLAEYRSEFPKEAVTTTVPVLEDSERVRATVEDIETDTEDFEELGEAFEKTCDVTSGQVGAATVKRMDQRALVDFAVEWFEENRSA